ncbi:sulfate transporter family protein-like protein [Aaosphaeria arxii CBS 175.79]|uniref:Sulfate transporter family protein-like protein n=1 Tax=Aaosphaeria arxii CBS 175.79 TaxID=1450172 RepID=A0A6A5XZT9_9PLEO|nr:sulfate transporter family protein-like protein [Aaosphaeria arxii CBS 175.79]KAF2018722.1 sulfate transporter family protein-like protein [Aaosphaeria arxii CBS 175.79]
MSARLSLGRRGDSDDGRQQQQLPFAGEDDIQDDIAALEQSASGSATLPRSRSTRAASVTAGSLLSSSFSQRTPARSFAHQASHSGPENPPQYSSHGVRERSSQLASYALDSEVYQDRDRALSFADSDSFSGRRRNFYADVEFGSGRRYSDSIDTDVVDEESEPESSSTIVGTTRGDSSSQMAKTKAQQKRGPAPEVVVEDTESYLPSERTPLLPKARLSRTDSQPKPKATGELQAEPLRLRKTRFGFGDTWRHGKEHISKFQRTISSPKTYTKEAAIAGATASLQTLSAVFLGLLLNILDALSYGYILFPLGESVFSKTGPDGISIFFVSCIVSQLCYSFGLSVFRGGVGSEMIEVVPFFHKMTYSIMAKMEGESDEAIMATVIVAYCLSSIVTGLIFLALGGFKLGNLVSFFPRHILIGCIGGVGFFLVVTGIEVSARLEGNLNYDFETLQKLFSHDTVYLWMLPLALAIIVLILRRLNKSPFILPAFFIVVFAAFYTIVKGILKLDLENVRNSGWIFEKPEAGVPFYRFYSYFKFGQVDGAALASTIPTMFALSFFGIIHVPINVPALGAAVKEDDVNVNRELIAHGISNTLSGCVGSIQNYLVYANSILFIANGGDSRFAGFLLAMATTAVWVAGPAMIGFIPVCLVGALIFLLGIELMQEAVWDTFGKCHKLEYLTIIAIVLIMGVYDFVVGIFTGIVMACLSYVVQSSRTPAVRATYSGEVAESTVRRPRADRRYLSQVRGQIRVIKLSGFLFFGTIVSVEEYMRSLIEDDNFRKQPIGFIVVDFSHVTDVDFSSSEGFARINRILNRKGVKMVLSSVSFSNKVGQALQNVGLLDVEKSEEDSPPPRVFEDLNTALESCENELLEAFYLHCRHNGSFSASSMKRKTTPPISISHTPAATTATSTPAASLQAQQPSQQSQQQPTPSLFDPQFHSPRRGAQYLAAAATMRAEQGGSSLPNHTPSDHLPSSTSPNPSPQQQQHHPLIPNKWKSLAQPLKILLQTFEDVSTRNEDFWHRLAPYFTRQDLPAGTVLYSRGDEPNGFYILERGRFRAEYALDQGRFYEVILPGTTCGELPFFSETDRTGTVAAEEDSVAWLLTRERFRELEGKEREVASELLKVGLKLTKERMDAITSYVLVTA